MSYFYEQEYIDARIKIVDSIPISNQRILLILAKEQPNDNFARTQKVVLHVQISIVDLDSDQDGIITTRFLAPSNKISYLLARNDSIIAHIKKATRANIHIIANNQLSRCALETNELIQIVDDICVGFDHTFKE